MKITTLAPSLLERLHNPSDICARSMAMQVGGMQGEACITQVIEALQNQQAKLALFPALEALNTLKNKPEIDALLGHILEQLNQPCLAQKIYEEALSRFPTNHTLLQCCARIYQISTTTELLEEKKRTLQALSSIKITSDQGKRSSSMVFELPPLSESPFNLDPCVDVLLPVFKGYNETLECVSSLLEYRSANTTPHEIVVLDDASPDTKLVDILEQLAKKGAIQYIRHPLNLGFIKNMNHGMALHPNRDVVWLNADTRVHGNWLDRLRANAYHHPQTASATPFSNNGELMSFPKMQIKAPMPSKEEQGELDLLASLFNYEPIEIPLGCGFCFYIKREALNQVGLLDEIHLDRGYGEETDWCMRASAQGWKHVGAPNLYVAHQGGVSFGLEKLLRVVQNNERIRQRHPTVDDVCDRFRVADPLRGIRKKLVLHLSQAEAVVQAPYLKNLVLHAQSIPLEGLISNTVSSYWLIADDLSTPEIGQAWLTLARSLKRAGLERKLILTQETPWQYALLRTGAVAKLTAHPVLSTQMIIQLSGVDQALTLKLEDADFIPLLSKLSSPLTLNYLSPPIASSC